MRIRARGWKRDSGPTTIMDQELCEGRADSVSYYEPNVLYLDRTEKGVDLRIGPQALTFGGKYQIEINLSNDDVIELFLVLNAELSKHIEAVFTARRRKLNKPLRAARADTDSDAP